MVGTRVAPKREWSGNQTSGCGNISHTRSTQPCARKHDLGKHECAGLWQEGDAHPTGLCGSTIASLDFKTTTSSRMSKCRNSHEFAICIPADGAGGLWNCGGKCARGDHSGNHKPPCMTIACQRRHVVSYRCFAGRFGFIVPKSHQIQHEQRGGGRGDQVSNLRRWRAMASKQHE